jgi:hypothetical protein
VSDPKGKTIATRDFDATVKCLRRYGGKQRA